MNHSAYKELQEIIENIAPQQKAELLSAIWLGRGDFTMDEWPKALDKAKNYNNDLISDYIITLPDACSYLSKGLLMIELVQTPS